MMKRIYSKINNGVLRPVDMKSTKNKVLYLCLLLIMLMVLVVLFVPVVWMIMFCFKEPAEIYSRTASFFPEHIDLGKIGRLWVHLEIYKYYINTIIMAGGCVVFDLIINGLAGYALSRLKPKGHGGFMFLVSMLMLVPATCAMVPNYMLYKEWGLLNTYVPMWIIAGVSLFDILLLKSAFDGVSISLIEAARIDGASDVKIFYKIVIPLSIPVIATCAIFMFNAQFGNFFWPYLIITKPELKTMAVRLYEIKGSTLPLDEQMTAVMFSIIPQIIIFVLFQKQIVSGINIGGVKG